MTITPSFSQLAPHDRALVAVAVLLDGADAVEYIEGDATRGEELHAAARELLKLDLDVRLPYVGTMLRLALEERE